MQISAKADFFRSHLENCQLCPRMCGVNRLRGELGFCMAGNKLKIASYCLHFGEEPPISGNRGSGTIFFAHCNMRCVYCQNFPISHMGHGNHVEPAGLASMMLELQTAGAHNINLVTPTHFLPRIVEGLLEARADGLTLPVVYNSSGFERPETVRMLSGLVQVYLVDMRYSTEKSARRYSKAPDYPRYNRLAVREMLSQVGPLRPGEQPADSGVIIRHLVLPGLLAETEQTLEFISTDLSTNVPVSLMSQYFPANEAHLYPELDRKITEREYDLACSLLARYDLREGWLQDPVIDTRPIA